MNPNLKQHRIDLACALRWAARLNLHEGVDNHFSLAVPWKLMAVVRLYRGARNL